MRNVYFISIIAGILSVPLFIILLLPIAASQLGTSGTSEAFETTTFALLIALTGGLGCWFVAREAKGTVSFAFGPRIVFLQVLLGLLLFAALLMIGKITLAILPDGALFNPGGSDSTTKQTIGWLTVLLPLVFQHVLFWGIAISVSSNKKDSR